MNGISQDRVDVDRQPQHKQSPARKRVRVCRGGFYGDKIKELESARL